MMAMIKRIPMVVMVFCCLLSQMAGKTCGAESTNRELLALWDKTLNVSVGGGYRDNVLRTSVAPEGSAFFSSAADFSLIRLSESGAQWTFFGMGEDIRYFDSKSVPKEQIFSGTTQFEIPLGLHNHIGAFAQYLYQNQVIDASETEANLSRVFVEGQSISFKPEWQYQFSPAWSVKINGAMLRQLYVSELDDYWEGGGRVALVYKYGHRSEIWLGYESRHRFYDTRHQTDREGFMVEDTSLLYWQHEIGSGWKHYWDEKRHWRTTTKVSLLLNRDNGAGYFDYDRTQVAQQIRWQNGPWEVTANGRFGYYYYSVQRIAESHRERAYYGVDLRVQRRLGKYAYLFVGGEREWDFSNDPLDDYRDWMANLGIGVEF
jgi:hypothetical protein